MTNKTSLKDSYANVSFYKRITESTRKLEKAIRKKEKARAWRIWVERNPHIHILNYPYFRIKDRKEVYKLYCKDE